MAGVGIMLRTLKSTCIFGTAFIILGLGACATQSSDGATAANATSGVESAPASLADIPFEEMTPEQRKTARRQALRTALLERQARAREEDPVICDLEEVTGSRLAKVRLCARDSERDASRNQTRIELDDMNRRAASGGLGREGS